MISVSGNVRSGALGMSSKTAGEPVKIADIAAAAGVSAMTVSRAMRGIEGVSPAKRDEILRLAKRLGYRPNRNAVALAVANSNLIGISLPILYNDVFAEILDGMRGTFDRAGFETVIDISDYSLEREAAWVERMIDWRPAGVVLTGVLHAPQVRARLLSANIPTLEIWDHTPDPIDLCVGIEHVEAGLILGRHLVRCGYRRPAFVGVRHDRDPRAEKRIQGLDRAFRGAGLAELVVARVDRPASFEAGKLGTLAILDQADPWPDVICYLNDHMAFAGLAACEMRGMAVPRDIGIAGFNGLGINAVLPRPLTTIVTPRLRIGRQGAQNLMARIHKARADRSLALSVELFKGETTCAQSPPG